jgi:hypothetical protein
VRAACRCTGVATLVLASLLGLACGGSRHRVDHVWPQTLTLHWRESPGVPGARLIVGVERIVVGTHGWTVRGSLRNDTRVDMALGRPHRRGEFEFGLMVLPSPDPAAVDSGGVVFASRISPRPPSLLRAGRAWRGSFGGPQLVGAGEYVRVVFGRFSPVGRVPGLPRRFRYVTDHVERLR